MLLSTQGPRPTGPYNCTVAERPPLLHGSCCISHFRFLVRVDGGPKTGGEGRGGEKMFELKWPGSQCYVAAAAASWLSHCEKSLAPI